MKTFSVSVTAEPLKETVRVEVPRAIVYDKFDGVLKLDGNHPQIKRIREIVNEYMSFTADNDPNGMKRDALLDEVKSLTSKTDADAVLYYESDASKAKRDAENEKAAKKWLADLEGTEIYDLPEWGRDSGVVCQVFKITRDEMKKRDVHDPLYVALNHVFYYGYTCGQKAVTP